VSGGTGFRCNSDMQITRHHSDLMSAWTSREIQDLRIMLVKQPGQVVAATGDRRHGGRIPGHRLWSVGTALAGHSGVGGAWIVIPLSIVSGPWGSDYNLLVVVAAQRRYSTPA